MVYLAITSGEIGMSGETTIRIQVCLDRIRGGDAAARNDLIAHACGRLERLAAKLYADFPGLQRWVGSEDVLQNAAIRLTRALQATSPESPRQFFRLAAVQIRRELIDLARRYRGPEGPAAHHVSWSGDTSAPQPAEASSVDPARLAEWTEWHEMLAKLPEEERELVDLLWYHELEQQEVADMLKISLRTVKRRWQQTRLSLHSRLKSESP